MTDERSGIEGDAPSQQLGTVRRKVSTRDPFSPFVPFDPAFKERVPGLFVFHAALASLHYLVRGMSMPALGDAAAAPPRSSRWVAAECGVYRGHALIAYAELARRSGIPVHFYGLDTFSGLPVLSAVDRECLPTDAPALRETLFADTSLDEVQRRIDEHGLGDCITLVAGEFETTLGRLPATEFFFVSIDCDLHTPHLECLEYFYPRLIRGGIIYLDDYHSVEYPMARLAIDEFMRDKPEEMFHLRYGAEGKNQTKTFIVKF
jgi:hypothetical protein